MNQDRLHQVRMTLAGDWADAMRRHPDSSGLDPLNTILRRHRAVAVCTLDAFEAYVAQAEQHDAGNVPLYRWTKAILADPARRAKHATGFTLRIDGAEIYPERLADALEAELHPLVGAGVVTRVSRHDTDPASNPQIPPQYRG